MLLINDGTLCAASSSDDGQQHDSTAINLCAATGPACDHQALREAAQQLSQKGFAIQTVIPVALCAEAHPKKRQNKSGDWETVVGADGKPEPAYVGKNPSHWQRNGEPRLASPRESVGEGVVLERIAIAEKLGKPIGLAICPTPQLVVLDFDRKNYQAQEDLDQDWMRLLDLSPELTETRIERTPAGGVHIYLRVADGMESWRTAAGRLHCNFTTTPGGSHRGEVLTAGRIAICAPSRSGSGPYELLNPEHAYDLVEVQSLARLGIFPVGKQEATKKGGSGGFLTPQQLVDLLAEEAGLGSSPPALADLLGEKAQAVLMGQKPYGEGDRSTQLTGFAKEAYGCENLLDKEGLPYRGSADELIGEAIKRLEIEDKWDRVLDSINRQECSVQNAGNRIQRYKNLAGFSSETATHPPAESSKSADILPTYEQLLKSTLAAVRCGDISQEMGCRAEIITRFRRNDGQISAELFKLLTAQEGGGSSSSYGAVDIANAKRMRWLLDGFIPANDQVLFYGEAGAGKTTSAIALAFAVINGTGLLDRSAKATPGRVLFISSDSGKGPLMELLERSSYSEHPALRDGRFTVWAYSKEESRKAWDASIAGCLALLEEIKITPTDLVIIDSCKAVTSKADIEYTSNLGITSLLTFFQEVICTHCSVIWLNHDGTGKGMHAGAKAWREIPSSVHYIEKLEEPQNAPASGPTPRRWTVRKCRMGSERQFRYTVCEQTGRLMLSDEGQTPVVGDCSTAIIRILEEAHKAGKRSLSRLDLIEGCFRQDFSAKTTDNALSNLHRGRQVIRPTRGRYSLAPKLLQALSHRPPEAGALAEHGAVEDWWWPDCPEG